MKTKPSCHELSPVLPTPEGLNRDETCPFCGGDNRCRVAKGHLYKGPCWCQQISVPQPVLRSLAADRLEPSCLCRPCLETVARLSRELPDADAIIAEMGRYVAARQQPPAPEDFYVDDGNVVFTAAYHLGRGNCCQHDCRHCPY